jgi:hypothetical protein
MAVENSVAENDSILAALEQPKDRPILTGTKFVMAGFQSAQTIAGKRE